MCFLQLSPELLRAAPPSRGPLGLRRCAERLERIVGSGAYISALLLCLPLVSVRLCLPPPLPLFRNTATSPRAPAAPAPPPLPPRRNSHHVATITTTTTTTPAPRRAVCSSPPAAAVVTIATPAKKSTQQTKHCNNKNCDNRRRCCRWRQTWTACCRRRRASCCRVGSRPRARSGTAAKSATGWSGTRGRRSPLGAAREFVRLSAPRRTPRSPFCAPFSVCRS